MKIRELIKELADYNLDDEVVLVNMNSATVNEFDNVDDIPEECVVSAVSQPDEALGVVVLYYKGEDPSDFDAIDHS